MNGLHVFIDESNLRIQSKTVGRRCMGYDDPMVVRLRINYGNLLERVQQGRALGSATIVGSRPPAGDKFWATMKAMGIAPKVFDRVFREKRVDAEMTNSIRDCLEDNPEPGTVALVAGDQDYIPTLERCLKREWTVEVWFWEHATSGDLRRLEGIKFHDLTGHFGALTFLEKPGAPQVRDEAEMAYEATG